MAGLVAFAALFPLTDLFYFCPGIDRAVARFFAEGGRFVLADFDPLVRLRAFGFYLTKLSYAFAALGLVVPFLFGGRRFAIGPRWSLFYLCSAILGSGLLVNYVLKDHWGRARPYQLAEFGGHAAYTKVWEFSDACATNCSFVSGEASSSILLLGFVLLATPRLRLPTLVASGTLALAFSVNRLAFGGHFLSDVMLSWCLTVMVMALCHALVYAPRLALTDERLAGWLGERGAAAGRFLSRLWHRLR